MPFFVTFFQKVLFQTKKRVGGYTFFFFALNLSFVFFYFYKSVKVPLCKRALDLSLETRKNHFHKNTKSLTFTLPFHSQLSLFALSQSSLSISSTIQLYRLHQVSLYPGFALFCPICILYRKQTSCPH